MFRPEPTPTFTSTPTPTSTPIPTSTPTPLPDNLYYSQVGWRISGNSVYVFGEVTNNNPDNARSIKVIVTFYMPNGSLAGSNYSYTHVLGLLPYQRSTFKIMAQPAAGWTTFTLTGDYYREGTLKNTPFQNVSLGSGYMYFSYYKLTGQVANNTGQPIRYVKAMGLFWNSSGSLIDADYTYTSPNILASGQSAPFEIWTDIYGTPPATQQVYSIGEFYQIASTAGVEALPVATIKPVVVDNK